MPFFIDKENNQAYLKYMKINIYDKYEEFSNPIVDLHKLS